MPIVHPDTYSNLIIIFFFNFHIKNNPSKHQLLFKIEYTYIAHHNFPLLKK